MPYMRPNAQNVATLLIDLVRATARHRDKDLSRARVRISTLRLLSGRTNIRDVFLDDVASELADLGWIWCSIDRSTFGLIQRNSALGWTRAGVSGVFENEIDEVEAGTYDFDGKWTELREALEDEDEG